jgi:outer membrane protein OmpA-like peptidoglycan-associated protein
VPDVRDKCPTPAGPSPDALWGVVEDRDGFEDDDGCPDPDNDGDGVEDHEDECPGKAEDIDGFDDADGCPDLDNDDDGVPDDRDDCPAEKEDIDGRLDDDGCPDPDNDGDGLPDERDSCPLAAEDRDGFEDADGCPDPDNDGDGIADALDFCPDEAEDLDGVTDSDGCPDEPGRSRLVAIRNEQVIPLEPVEYEKDSAVLLPASERILDEVARVLVEHPELGAIRIEAHLDTQGDPDERRSLTQKQALAVMRYLVLRGVDPTRLVAQGLGADRPIDTRGTPEGRAANRRIKFQAVKP